MKPTRPILLRILAWTAAGLLLVGWVSLGLLFLGPNEKYGFFTTLFLSSHLATFVLGLSSCERLGGLSAGLAVLTLTGWLAWANALAAAG